VHYTTGRTERLGASAGFRLQLEGMKVCEVDDRGSRCCVYLGFDEYQEAGKDAVGLRGGFWRDWDFGGDDELAAFVEKGRRQPKCKGIGSSGSNFNARSGSGGF
jgi:hypothetical protein